MADSVTLLDLEKVLDDLIMQERAYDLQPGEFTVKTVQDKGGWSRSRAEKVIAGWVQDGKAEPVGERREPERGQRVDAWRLK